MINGIGQRLREARERGAISARKLDRLAGHAEGHCAILEAREDGDAWVGTLAGYVRVLGLSLDWLGLGRGRCPSAERIRAAIRTAERAAG